MENYFKNKGLFELISKWKYHLLILMLVAGGLSVLFSSSLFIHPKFESKAVLYPFNISPLSEESETEQMLEIIKSNDIRFDIYEAFDLDEHYGIAPNDPEYLNILNSRFDKHISFGKTPNEAIEITFLDSDPQLASDVVDSIIMFYNQKVLALNRNKSGELVKSYKHEIRRKHSEIDSLTGVLNKYRKENNLLDYGIQVEEYSEAIAQGKNLKDVRKELNNWKEFGGEYLKTDSLLWNAMKIRNGFQKKLDASILDSNKEISYAHVVSAPFPADKKAYPIRWVIVLFSVLGALIAGILVLIFIDKARISSKHRGV
ncbi:MAG: hypothetical protein ACLFM1_09120 [Bacteroidales bacterium]